MRLGPLFLAALLLAAPAVQAAEGDKKPVVDRVDINRVAMPVVWRGRLVNYVFVVVRLKLAAGRDGQALRLKEPEFRDALVRVGHRTPFVDPADLSRIDERALDAAMLPLAQRIAGPGVVTGVEVRSQQPRRRVGRPADTAPAGRPLTPE